MGRLQIKRSIFAVACFLLLAPKPSYATAAFYIEGGAGAVETLSSSPFFAGAPSTLGPGIDAEFAVFFSFSGGNAPVDFQLGAQGQYFNLSSGSTTYSMIAPYPMMRIQFSRVYIGLGATPLLFSNVQSTSSLNGFQSVWQLSYAGELGFLLPITPLFSFAITAGAEFVPNGGSASPLVLDSTILMRFYFGFSSDANPSGSSVGNNGPSKTSNEYKGWRYPFGFAK